MASYGARDIHREIMGVCRGAPNSPYGWIMSPRLQVIPYLVCRVVPHGFHGFGLGVYQIHPFRPVLFRFEKADEIQYLLGLIVREGLELLLGDLGEGHGVSPVADFPCKPGFGVVAGRNRRQLAVFRRRVRGHSVQYGSTLLRPTRAPESLETFVNLAARRNPPNGGGGMVGYGARDIVEKASVFFGVRLTHPTALTMRESGSLQGRAGQAAWVIGRENQADSPGLKLGLATLDFLECGAQIVIESRGDFVFNRSYLFNDFIIHRPGLLAVPRECR